MPARVARFVRTSLRVRLTLTYVVLFSILLIGLGLVFRTRLSAILDEKQKELLEEEWVAMRGYLRILDGRVNWFYDRSDPDEAFMVERLQRYFVILDAQGGVLEMSPGYKPLQLESPATVRDVIDRQRVTYSEQRDAKGVPYLVRSGFLPDDQQRGRSYFVSVARPIDESQALVDRFSNQYFKVLPVVIMGCLVLGWITAGRALKPVTEVAQTAMRITSDNLNLQIPTRGARDELDHLIRSFNEMVKRLNASFTMSKQFSTDVSHELRTPITAIRGQLEVAMFTADTVDDCKEAMGIALQEVERLSQIVRQLLLLSQAEGGQLRLQRGPVEMREVVRHTVDQLYLLADDAGVQLEMSAPQDVVVEADRIQMERLLTNLVSNGIKYNRAGGRVTIALQKTSENAVLTVEDTGKGIAPESLPFIFDRFYRAPKEAENTERGLGLGLSFVSWIVKAHGGKIGVESKLDVGTKFTVQIPLSAVFGSDEGKVRG